jgi:diguanylate cyclase
MTEDTSWKDKYLRELEDAEQRGKAWEERIHALERMLVRTCLAAQGQDSKLDDALAEVRALVREENAGGPGWQKLQDRIDRRISHLDELREKGEREHKRSLFGRLLGRDEADTDTKVPEDPVSELQPGSVDLDTGEEDCTDQRLRIARRVGELLKQLRRQVTLEPEADERAKYLQDHLITSDDWDELRDGLNGVADLVIAALTRSQREFEGFLRRLDERLQALQQHFSEQQSAQTSRKTASQELENEIREELDVFSRRANESSSLEELKDSVAGHLGNVSQAVSLYREREAEREAVLTSQLEAMQEKLAAVEAHSEQMSEQLQKERSRALTDLLTDLPNRQAWEDRLELEYNRWLRYGHPLSISVLDIDFFKRVNDSYGHKAGDRVLQLVARALRERFRNTDFIARYGGEEFVVLLPDTSLQDAAGVLNEVREHIATLPFHFRTEPVSVTFSAGVTQFADDEGLEEAFERADRALYQAKDAGRNQVVVAGG